VYYSTIGIFLSPVGASLLGEASKL
jgi:hypothetical protein